MSSVNKVILLGNVTHDPELRHLPEGDPVVNLSVATNEAWKDKNGAKQEKAEFHRVIFFKRLAEIVSSYIKKGSKIYIEGKIQYRKWQDKDGQDRYTTEIIASEMKMLGGKQDADKKETANFEDDIPL